MTAFWRLLAGPSSVDPGRRRLLLISYHFPPGPAVGGLRWLRFAGIAAELGWSLDVITADPALLARQDPGRLVDLPADTRVFGVRPDLTLLDRLRALRPKGTPRPPVDDDGETPANGTPSPAGNQVSAPSVIPTDQLRWQLDSPLGWKRLVRVAAHLTHERAWAAPAARAGIALAREVRYAAVISSGPPHLPHLAAVKVARAIGRPAVLDFRDPWSTMRATLYSVATPAWPKLNRRLERRAVTAARLSVFNTEPATESMRSRYPELADRFITVMNGADDGPMPRPPRREKFLIAYAGNIYIDRNPRTVFVAARRVIDRLGLTPAQFGIEFMGHADRLDGQTVQEIAAETGVLDFFRQHPVGPRQGALDFLAQAAVLVSLPQSTLLSIPSKAFEYLGFEAWPMLLAVTGSATEQLFRNTSVPVFAPGDTDAIAAMLEDRYRRFAAGERPGPVQERERFSRAGQARVLFDAIDAIVETAGPA